MTPKQIWPTHPYPYSKPIPFLYQIRLAPTPKPKPLTSGAPFWRHPPTLHFWQRQFLLDLDTKALPFGFFCPIIKAEILVIVELYILWYEKQRHCLLVLLAGMVPLYCCKLHGH